MPYSDDIDACASGVAGSDVRSSIVIAGIIGPTIDTLTGNFLLPESTAHGKRMVCMTR